MIEPGTTGNAHPGGAATRPATTNRVALSPCSRTPGVSLSDSGSVFSTANEAAICRRIMGVRAHGLDSNTASHASANPAPRSASSDT